MSKKIMIIDGGPRKNMNTAQMIDKFIDGVKSTGGDIEVKHVRLYDYDFHGCYSCMLCKMRNSKFHDYCGRKDGISDVLKEAAYADGIVFASPIFYGDITAQTKCFFERLTYPWLNYEEMSFNPPKKNMPCAIIYTMNASKEYQQGMENMYQANEELFSKFFSKPERILALSTKQVKDYSRFEFTDDWAQSHDKWHDEHFAEELQNAFDSGKRMAKQVL
jgi:multimeric flavodoxin WrbA